MQNCLNFWGTHLEVIFAKSQNIWRQIEFQMQYFYLKPQFLLFSWKNPGMQVKMAHLLVIFTNLSYIFVLLTCIIGSEEDPKEKGFNFQGAQNLSSSHRNLSRHGFWRKILPKQVSIWWSWFCLVQWQRQTYKTSWGWAGPSSAQAETELYFN